MSSQVDKEFVVSLCLKLLLPFQVKMSLIKAVHYHEHLFVVDGVSALAFRELAGFVGHG